MAYNKRRYRRVHVPFPIERMNWSGSKVTMYADGHWHVNLVGGIDAPNRPLFIALGTPIDPHFTEFEKKNGRVTFRSWPSLAPTHYGEKCGRKPRHRTMENRFNPVEGGLRVPK